MKRLQIFLKWFFAVAPIGLFTMVTAPVLAPLAWLIEQILPNHNPFWWWLDDEIEHEATNEDWLIYKQKTKFAWYIWHGIRNTGWNLKNLFKPEQGKLTLTDVVIDNIWCNGDQMQPTATATYKWIDENGNEGYQVNSGVKISKKYSIIGTVYIFFTVNNKSYFRYSTAREIKLFGKTYYLTIKLGTNNKRNILTLKIQKK
jgi:hypothetical protein